MQRIRKFFRQLFIEEPTGFAAELFIYTMLLLIGAGAICGGIVYWLVKIFT